VILRDERHGTDHTVPPEGARLGRDPSLEIAFPDSEDVVSALHCRVIRHGDETWWLEDLGSTNGTWVKGQRMTEPVRLVTGSTFSLGQRGPVMRVAIPGQLAQTQQEVVADLVDGAPFIRLRRVKGGEDLVASGTDIVLGRSAGCQVPLRTVADTVVSKRHARISFDDEGRASLTDLGSRNGTYLNGNPVQGEAKLKLGDRVMLGWQGPMFELRMIGGKAMPEGEGAPYQPAREPRKSIPGMFAAAEDEAAFEQGGRKKVRTGVFVKSMARQIVTESSHPFRLAVGVAFLVLVAAIVLVWEQSARRAAEAADRLASAETIFAGRMHRADSMQQHASAELAQMRLDLETARRNAVSRIVLDSMEQRLREAEARAAAPRETTLVPLAAAMPPRDFTDIARMNGRAVGLVVVRFPSDSGMGSGFAITASGFFITARHVVRDDSLGPARTVMVIMEGSNLALPADVVAVSGTAGQDVAILKVRGYRGPMVQSIDWVGRGAQQGAPAVMLGFPLGTALGQDAAGYVHSTLFGGFISQTGDLIRFSATTYAGVSGSPVFNASGDVVAVHVGEPRGAHGLGVSLPMSKVRRWLPLEARVELGL
jgi:pSer/pThr/pTyr-binding forkhead associated (FHA) protein/S1-C subfamily serine protease